MQKLLESYDIKDSSRSLSDKSGTGITKSTHNSRMTTHNSQITLSPTLYHMHERVYRETIPGISELTIATTIMLLGKYIQHVFALPEPLCVIPFPAAVMPVVITVFTFICKTSEFIACHSITPCCVQQLFRIKQLVDYFTIIRY